MEAGNCSAHLKPHILPPLATPRISNELGKTIHENPDKPKHKFYGYLQLRQRIGTPAPQKKSPISDDLDLNNLSAKRGHPTIKVESLKLDDLQKNKHQTLLDKTVKLRLEDVSGSGNNNLNCRLPKKSQLQPIMNPIFNIKANGDVNGNDILRKPASDMKIISPDKSLSGKMHLPNKYTRLKPIVRKEPSLD